MSEDWRNIPCSLVDWHCLSSINRRTALLIERQCSEPTKYTREHYPEEAEGRWTSLTLGELADRGEKWWVRRGERIGKACVDAIKSMIDHAAAGYEIRKDHHSTQAYQPRPIPAPPENLRRKEICGE